MTYRGLRADMVNFRGHNGDRGEAYYARPSGAGPFPGVVVIHHAPGWDEWCMEATRKFAHHGYAAICPNLYFRNGPGSVDDVAAKVRAAGGVSDEQSMADVAGSMQFLRSQADTNGKVGVIGFCSGGRQTYLAACTIPNVDAAVDCWGGRVVVNNKADITPQRPVAPIEFTEKMTAPLLGIFGNDDPNPSPADVNKIEETLKKLGKKYEFHRYDGAAHGFFAVDRPGYRPAQAKDAWEKVFAFYAKHIGTPAAGR